MKQPTHLSRPATPASAGRQGGFLNSRQALVLIALIFLAPTFVAWVMHTSTGQGWRPEGTTNHGILVQPPRPLSLPAGLVGRDGKALRADYLQGRWTLLTIDAGVCTETCRNNLYKIRQVQLAQGEFMHRVQRLFMVRAQDIPASLETVLAEYPDLVLGGFSAADEAQLAPFFLIDEVPMLEAERVYIVDPLGNLMMYYPPDADPSGMLKDLQKLLKYSKIG